MASRPKGRSFGGGGNKFGGGGGGGDGKDKAKDAKQDAYRKSFAGGGGGKKSQAFGGGGGGDEKDEVQESIDRLEKQDKFDDSMGYERYSDGPERIGWLLNMRNVRHKHPLPCHCCLQRVDAVRCDRRRRA